MPQAGYPPQTGYPQPPPPAGAVPAGAVPSYQYNVTVQPQQRVVVVGGCPACRVSIFKCSKLFIYNDPDFFFDLLLLSVWFSMKPLSYSK